jgi:hypothetical protein
VRDSVPSLCCLALVVLLIGDTVGKKEAFIRPCFPSGDSVKMRAPCVPWSDVLASSRLSYAQAQ